jgi:hypothetical protein
MRSAPVGTTPSGRISRQQRDVQNGKLFLNESLVALAGLRSRPGIVVVWACNLWGSADLLNAFYQGDRTGLGDAPGLMGAAYFIPTLLVPLLLTTHWLMFRLLLQGDGVPDSRDSQRA